MLLENKITVVTGGGSGLGLGIAERFAEEGATVVVLDQTLEKATSAAEGLGGGRDHLGLAVDVSDVEQVDAAFAEVAEKYGRADALVNSAGVREVSGPLELSAEEWNRVLGVNLSGTFFCCQAAARQLMGDGGSIVNVASVAGLVGFELRPAYGATKAGVLGLTRSLAHDLGSKSIRVNALCPGLTRTPMTEPYFADTEFLSQLPRTIPMGRSAEPDEMAQAALFLASEMSSYITGVSLPVDGGFVTSATFVVSDSGGAAFHSSASGTVEKRG